MESYGYLPPDKVLALCTGSQGEPRAALSRIAEDEHPEVTLAKGDRVIFSSRAIPGNEKAVARVINGLVSQGVEVITDRTHLVHVSGHPRRAELLDMIGWVRPKILIPAHGEALHLAEHAELARRAGVPHVLVCRNGDLVRLAPGRRPNHRRSALRPPLQGRLAVDQRRGQNRGGAPPPELFRHRHDRAGTEREGRPGRRSRNRADRHSRNRRRRRIDGRDRPRRGRGRVRSPCQNRAGAIPTR